MLVALRGCPSENWVNAAERISFDAWYIGACKEGDKTLLTFWDFYLIEPIFLFMIIFSDFLMV